uniref:Uncharacterized protein n=1 Tax=Arundo donax TaxID=35708 RepID=A0A0A9H9Y1_ARUDO
MLFNGDMRMDDLALGKLFNLVLFYLPISVRQKLPLRS